MAEYFPTRRDAEEFIQEWYAKDGKPPVFFGKIFNNGAEKWIVNYDARQNPGASPHIKVLEDHSGEIRTIVAAPRPVTPPRPETLYQIGDDYRDRERRRQKELQERRQKVAPDALRRFPLKKQSAFSVSFAPDGSLIAAGQYGYVNVWDVETGDVVTEIKASENAVHPVRFSPDGLVLAAGSYASYPYTGEVTLWSPTSGERLGKVQNDSGDMGQSFGFSLDGRVLALGAKDRRVHLFDVESGRRKHTITATKYVANSIAFAPPGLMLIAGVVPRQEHDSRVIPGIEIWDSTTFKPIRTLEAMEGFYIVGGLAVSPDGSMLAAGLSGNGGRVLLWDMKTFARTTLAGYNGAIDAVGFSPDGKYLAAGCQDKHVRVWDLARSEFKGQLQPLEEAVRSVAFAPGGRFFAAGSAGGGTSTLWVWPSDTVVNLRATEIKDRAGAVLATVEGKGLDGADLHGKTLDGAVLTGTRAIPATSGVVSRQDRAKPRESGLKRLLRSLFRR